MRLAKVLTNKTNTQGTNSVLFWRILLLAVLMLPGVSLADAEADAVRTYFTKNHDKAISTLQQLSSAGELDSQTALGAIKDNFSPMINYGKLSATAVGKYWRKATDAEKMQIIEDFQKLLELNFSRVLSKFSDQKVAVLESKKRDDGKIAVLTEVQGEPSAEIEYIFAGAGEQAKISDVKVEGVSLLSNYRRQFKQTLKKKGVSGLIAQLQKLTAK